MKIKVLFSLLIFFIFLSGYFGIKNYYRNQKVVADSQKLNDYQKVVNYFYSNKEQHNIDTILKGYKVERINEKCIILKPNKVYWDYYGIEIVLDSNQNIIEVNPFKP